MENSRLKLPSIEFNRFAKPFTRDEFLSRSWNIPGTPGYIHQLGGLEKQGEEGRVSYDAENHQKIVHLRQEKIEGVAREYTPLTIEGDVNASILLIGWGSTYGVLADYLIDMIQVIPLLLCVLRLYRFQTILCL
jgi:2-oxoglutarate/2-oxoacid ferredoxin oxidoreductase subunit alpha